MNGFRCPQVFYSDYILPPITKSITDCPVADDRHEEHPDATPVGTSGRAVVAVSREVTTVRSANGAEAGKVWYVLRITYQRELAVRDKLTQLGIEAFVPTRRVRRRTSAGRFHYTTEAAVHNYIFVHTTLPILRALKRERLPEVRYVMQNVGGLNRFLVVPDDQMCNFIAVAGNTDERVLYLPAADVDFSAGQRVRILGGPFEGVEGIFLRLTKKHERRVVVQVAGLFSVATTAIPACLVEKI